MRVAPVAVVLRVAPVAVVLCSALTGCASLTPEAANPGSTTTQGAAVANAETTHEYTSASPPARQAAVSAPSAIAAIRAFATAYINWTTQTVTDMRTLASASIGQARSAMQLAAANSAQDYELRRGGIANSGQVEAIAPLLGSRGRYIVVTQERTTATNTAVYQGLRPGWHVTVATVEEVSPGAWVLSGWQPES
jgi:hypothetical protein